MTINPDERPSFEELGRCRNQAFAYACSYPRQLSATVEHRRAEEATFDTEINTTQPAELVGLCVPMFETPVRIDGVPSASTADTFCIFRGSEPENWLGAAMEEIECQTR